VVNHTYKEIGLYPKDIVGGGTGSYYSADNIMILGRQQEQSSDKELLGYNFIINIEKSRYVREKSKIPITVTFDGGISKYSGMFEACQDAGIITEATKGRYRVTGGEVSRTKKELRADDALWESILTSEEFQTYIRNTYKLT